MIDKFLIQLEVFIRACRFCYLEKKNRLILVDMFKLRHAMWWNFFEKRMVFEKRISWEPSESPRPHYVNEEFEHIPDSFSKL